MRPFHRLALCLVVLVLLGPVAAVAQLGKSKPLIVARVDEDQLVTLKGNTPPVATAKNDLGRVSSNLPMTDLILVLHRSPEQQAEFDAFVASQYDPSSPNFHKWLAPAQIGEKFGPSLDDIATISAWLTSHGLSVDGLSKDRMMIRFSGTARQVEGAFHTEIHNLLVKGEAHISNMTDPQIPMALEPVVLGPKALHNFVPLPMHRLGSKVTLNKETGQWQRDANALQTNAVVAKPQFGLTGGSGSSTYPIEDVAPYDFATIYNVLPLWNNSIDGTGQNIGIAGRSDVRATDVAKFRSTFGLPAGTFNLIKNGTDPGYCTGSTGNCTLDDQIENALDVEWAGAVAKGATVNLVVTQQTNTNDAIFESAFYIIDRNIAPIINVSYGLCELGMGTDGNAAYNGLWQTAAAAGISVFVSTGDSGSPACDQGGSSVTGTPYGAKYGLSVNGIGSTPYNTAVGGTDLNWGATTATYWNATNDPTTGATAKGYMPEVPWNDSCTNPLALSYFQSWATELKKAGYSATSPTDAKSACNFIVQWWSTIRTGAGVDLSGFVDTSGAGGGASNCTTSDGSTVASCGGGYAKPSWQTGISGIPSDNRRVIPDVSFFASNGFLGSAYIICVSDWGTCVSSPTTTTEPSVGEIGGTSAASPAMAGVMALINQKAGTPQGNPNPELYSIAAKQTYGNCSTENGTTSNGCYFNDVDTGTISMPCALNSPNCTSSSGDSVGILTGFSAGVGYDEATGLGTMNVANVVNGWQSTTGTGAATVTVSASPSSISSIQGTTITVTVSGSGGTPTGTVFLSTPAFATSTQTLANGATTFTLPAGTLATGTNTLTAHYSGDSSFAASDGSTQVTVTVVSFTLSASAPANISAGGTATSTITVGSSNGYAGTVTLSCALTSSPSGAIEVPACAPTSGASTVTLSSTTTSGQGSVTVTTTPAPTGAHVAQATRTGWFKAAGGVALASLLFFFLPGWSKRSRNLLCTVMLAVACSFIAIGCGGGGGSSNGGGGGGTTKATPTVTVTPAKTSISETDSLAVNVAVAASGNSNTPTGTVTLTSGSYTSAATSLSAGAATVTIPAGKLAVGSDTLSVAYGGDTNFNSASGTGTVTVNKAATTSGTYTFTVTGTGNDAASTKATTTFTVTVN